MSHGFPAMMVQVPMAPALLMAAALLSPSMTLRAGLFGSLSTMNNGAVFTEDRAHRVLLYRVWDASKPVLPWIMLNPSTADAEQDDQTIRKCRGYATKWGYGGIVVANLFTFRATDPNGLLGEAGCLNSLEADAVLDMIAGHAQLVVCGWGLNGDLHARGDRVAARLARITHLRCLKVNADGSPVHPLYQPGDAELRPFPLRATPLLDKAGAA